jgi:hypothetical protein
VGFLIAFTAAAATVGTSIYEAVSQPQAPQAPNQAQAAQQQAQAAQAAALAQADALTKRRGMAATQLTSPLGTSGTATVGKATLGG